MTDNTVSKPLANRRVKRKYPLIVSFIFLVLMSLVYFNIVINITPSMPKGIYLKTNASPKMGSIVLVCLPKPYMDTGLANHYLISGSTHCNGMAPLIKEVVAIPGDNVILTDDHIDVNDKRLGFPTRYTDSDGESVNAYPRGNYPDTTGYWVIGTSNQKSWDSRYWGPVTGDYIKRSIYPLFIW